MSSLMLLFWIFSYSLWPHLCLAASDYKLLTTWSSLWEISELGSFFFKASRVWCSLLRCHYSLCDTDSLLLSQMVLHHFSGTLTEAAYYVLVSLQEREP